MSSRGEAVATTAASEQGAGPKRRAWGTLQTGVWRTARRLAMPAWDSAAWVVGLTAATWFRYDGDTALIDSGGLVRVLLVALVAHWVIAVALQLYRRRYWTGSMDDAIAVAVTMAMVGIIVFAVVLPPSLPPLARSIPLTGALVALMLSVGARVAIRRWQEHRTRPDGRSAHRVIVLGAGIEGRQLVRSMATEPGSDYLPVAMLDDDRDLRHRRISGIAVRGTRHDLADVAEVTRASLLVVAARDLDAAAMREVNRTATEAGLAIKVLPLLSELLRPGLADLRDLDITDLLGRRAVEVDIAAIAGYLTGKRVLVTGAGGSIGSELCRQINRFGPAELLMLDHDESGLHGTQLSIRGRACLDSSDVILADIRDAHLLTALFIDRRPEVIFHAAALKHLTMLEQYPDEAWETNVVGTQNVLDAAWCVGALEFVNISTDKAVDPTSVLGRSKRIGERLVAEAATWGKGTYLSVRFGNVLGSRGSMLTTFTEQLAAGGPITVTHPDVTRFFMTIPEASRLVVHAAAIGGPGEVLVLDMGEPVRIEDVAHQLMEISGRTVGIVYTGLRPGEKLHESLFGPGERDHRPIHPAVSHVAVPPLPMEWAKDHAILVGTEQAMIDLPLFPSLAPARGLAAGLIVPLRRNAS
jgi:FlaA1/EpsC-like NDP-sugar epimerase